jgi:hypothetical protein
MSIDIRSSQPGTASCRTLQKPPPLFRLGRTVATRGVLAHLEHRGIAADPFLRRRATGDWGYAELGIVWYSALWGMCRPKMPRRSSWPYSTARASCRRMQSLVSGVWLITEADRSATTLLPVGLSNAGHTNDHQMFHAYVKHASYCWRTIVQPPAIHKQLHHLPGILEAREHKELRHDVGRDPCQLRPLQPVTFR